MTLGETQVRRLLPESPQFYNYVEAWEQAQFSRYFLNSCIIVGVTIAGLLVVSVFAAYAFGRINFRGRNLVFTLLLITLMIPESVTLIPGTISWSLGVFCRFRRSARKPACSHGRSITVGSTRMPR
ncbi:MAG: carbohydrate ABC transporter permease [Chloroflexi bacterium]|nr:carbohydrate ABC transporter permease [Chloroflexota bacterium]